MYIVCVLCTGAAYFPKHKSSNSLSSDAQHSFSPSDGEWMHEVVRYRITAVHHIQLIIVQQW